MTIDIAMAKVAQPYAQALMSIAQSNNLSDQIGEDVRALLNLLNESDMLRHFIGNPFIDANDKKAVLVKILGDEANTYLLNLLMLLVDGRRISFLSDICEQYLVLLRRLTQTVLAEVTSALPLSESQIQTIKQKVIMIASAQQVELETKIDSNIIGGVIIKIGSQVVDASLRCQLRRISLRLSSS
ncbi:ATP synthase delta chain [Richelia intracellularis HM01]|uniref:ATP synthase F1 subunit delta n=1 Tax=Richelia intracellularis TaxID=1164990 RepID=UPI0002B5F8CE|nr:ATP synthase F1 subunit delta [Richelia intracellularis]CCH64848.1 ATP synthase delta chain [Richelia intracellularis HM01]